MIARVLAALKENKMEPEVVRVKVETCCVRQNVIVGPVQNLAKIK